MHKLSVAIMTLNEEAKIEKCISSVLSIADEVVLIDSHSTDRTVEIAQSLGAKIHTHTFQGYIKQRELSVSLCKYPFVLALDADEYLSKELAKEITNIKQNLNFDAYKLNRLSSINGVWIRHGKWFPNRIVRLFQKDSVRFVGDPPHDQIEVKTNNTGTLTGLLMHDCNEDIFDRISTSNNHSSQAAISRYNQGKRSNIIRLLLKPPVRFIIEYFINFGILDGFYGYIIAKTAAQYVFSREAKMIEIEKYTQKSN